MIKIIKKPISSNVVIMGEKFSIEYSNTTKSKALLDFKKDVSHFNSSSDIIKITITEIYKKVKYED